jgi:hypothetical protein
MPRQIVNNRDFLASLPIPNSAFMVLLKVFKLPIANFPRDFLNDVVFCLTNVYNKPVLGILARERLI